MKKRTALSALTAACIMMTSCAGIKNTEQTENTQSPASGNSGTELGRRIMEKRNANLKK